VIGIGVSPPGTCTFGAKYVFLGGTASARWLGILQEGVEKTHIANPFGEFGGEEIVFKHPELS
jgi:hypothetical protein